MSDLGNYVTEQFAELGVVTDGSVAFSLGHCQGDGVAIYGNLDLEKLAEKDADVKQIVQQAEKIDTLISVRITGECNRYHHWNSMTVETEHDRGFNFSSRFNDITPENRLKLYDRADKLASRLRQVVDQILKDASKTVEPLAYDWIDQEEECDRLIHDG